MKKCAMTDPLDLPSDAHLQAALYTGNYAATSIHNVRCAPAAYTAAIAHARTIAKAEQLEAELAAKVAEVTALREKYEPAPVDKVKVEAHQLTDEWDKDPDLGCVDLAEMGIRRGIKMQQPFTREEADRISWKLMSTVPPSREMVIAALTTPRDELAKMGEG